MNSLQLAGTTSDPVARRMSAVRERPSAYTAATAARMRAAASSSPRWSSIMAAERISAVGLATSLPAMSGAEPWTASNTA